MVVLARGAKYHGVRIMTVIYEFWCTQPRYAVPLVKLQSNQIFDRSRVLGKCLIATFALHAVFLGNVSLLSRLLLCMRCKSPWEILLGSGGINVA